MEDANNTTPLNLESKTLDPTLKELIFYSEAYLQTGILIIGFAFNIINFIVLKKTKITETFRVCMLALTTTDACACVFGTVQLIVESAVFHGDIEFGYWNTAALANAILYYVFLMFMCTSSVYVILVAAVRAHMISQPYKFMENLNPQRLKVICTVIMATTAILFLPCPLYIMWQVCYAEDNMEKVCVNYFKQLPHVRYMKYYLYAISVLFGPMVIIGNITCLLIIHCSLKKSQKRSDRLTSKKTNQQNYYKRITRMLFVILILDIVWLVPTCVQYLGLLFSPEDTVFNSTDASFKIYDIIAEVLLLFRPTYNMFVYLITNHEYTRTFKDIFCQCKNKDNDRMFTELNNSTSANVQVGNQYNNRECATQHKSESSSYCEVTEKNDVYVLPKNDQNILVDTTSY